VAGSYPRSKLGGSQQAEWFLALRLLLDEPVA
jgi:hypothetical protein